MQIQRDFFAIVARAIDRLRLGSELCVEQKVGWLRIALEELLDCDFGAMRIARNQCGCSLVSQIFTGERRDLGKLIPKIQRLHLASA